MHFHKDTQEAQQLPIYPREANIETAFTWWSELPAKWTPVGWKDHLFRFNVLYNGMISAVPDLNPRTRQYQGQGVQLGVFPSQKAEFPGHVIDPQDNGSVIQGWADCSAPVLWSEWAQDGLVLREQVFAHVLGGQAVETGVEPLFAWIRLSIHDVLEGLPLPETFGFNLLINAPYIEVGAMSIRYNIAVFREKSAYPRELSASQEPFKNQVRIVEPDGLVRLAVILQGEQAVQVLPSTPTDRDFLIFVPLEVKKGAYVDLLLPMLPTPKEIFDQEVMLGYDCALREANSFWVNEPPTAAVFQTPEQHINNTIRYNLKMAEITAERDPSSGFYSLLTGSWAYADLWATPGAMQCAMFLDAMGYHATAAKYLKMYVEAQGTVCPVGDYFRPHPGSLGPPRCIAACVWTSDHGAILWALAQHALIAGDPEWTDWVTEPIVKACEYIRDTRRISGHGGIEGLMPPGMATDMPTKIQSVWADAWTFKGLTTAVRFLRRINHPRAEEFAAEAEDYRRLFRKSLWEAMADMPIWTGKDGRQHRIVPMAVFGAQPFEYRNAFYLDTGPLALVFAGLCDADEDVMRSTIEWFREGPPRRVYRYDSDCWQVPSLHHEMSSCEPCFSWNLFHSWQLGDRAHFLEGMYSLFAGAVSRQTYTACETRGGVTGCTGAHLPVYMARLAVVDDQIAENELHLLRLFPLAWVDALGSESVFENMPTEFGPVSLRVRLNSTENQLEVRYHPRYRIRPSRVVLHVPPIEGLRKVAVSYEHEAKDKSSAEVHQLHWELPHEIEVADYSDIQFEISPPI